MRPSSRRLRHRLVVVLAVALPVVGSAAGAAPAVTLAADAPAAARPGSIGPPPVTTAVAGHQASSRASTASVPRPPGAQAPSPLGAAPAGSTDPNAVTTPPAGPGPPAGHALTADQARRIARSDPKVAAVRARTRGSYDRIFLKGQTRWQLSVYAPGKPLREIGQVIVDDATGRITESWDGPYVAWTMARGYDGAFGRSITNPWLWGLLTLLFLVPFVRIRPVRLPPVPLLLLMAFGVPLACFNNARLDWAVPLSFALLVGLFLWSAVRGLRRPRAGPRTLDLTIPVLGLVALGAILLAFRIVLNVTDGNVIDVGYASVVGAHKIGTGASVYGVFPSDIGRGDTYGPLTYLAYVPFEQLFPWSGHWDDLPAAHAAAVGFDLLTVAALFLLGRRQERDPAAGRRRGVLYAYLWLACPWSAYALNSNANDGLVAAAMALLLLVAARPLARGLMAGAAGAAKIAPLAALPVLATRRRIAATVPAAYGAPVFRPVPWVALGAALVVLAAALIALHGEPFRVLWDRTVGYQAGRAAPFMPWGYYDLDVGRTVARALSVGFALVVALLPRRHDLTGTAALVLAVVVGLQLATEYWFYLYLTWGVPLLLVAALGDRPLRVPTVRRRPAVVPRFHGPVAEEDAPWAARARATTTPGRPADGRAPWMPGADR